MAEGWLLVVGCFVPWCLNASTDPRSLIPAPDPRWNKGISPSFHMMKSRRERIDLT